MVPGQTNQLIKKPTPRAKTGTNPGTKKEGGRWGQLQGVISTPEHV